MKSAIHAEEITTAFVDSAGSGVNCAGYWIARVFLSIGPMDAGATLDLRMQESNDNGDTDPYTDIPGAAFATIYDDQAGSDKLGIIVFNEGRKPWVRPIGTVTVGNVSFAVIIQPDRPTILLDNPEWRAD
jgi:hypothetical protein